MSSTTTLLNLYRIAYKIRQFEQTVVKLQKEGQIPKKRALLYTGQEGVASGIGLALEKSDYVQSSHRGHGHLIAKGGDIKLMLAELMGKHTGYGKGRAGFMHLIAMDVGFLGETGIVGAGIPIAVGAALSQKIQKTNNIVAVFFGDGAANQGTFCESLNMASVWNLPILFIVENNKRALGTPQEKVTAGKDIIEKAKAIGIKSIKINGNDAEQVYLRAKELINEIRNSNRPALIECETILLNTYDLQTNPEIDPVLILRNRLVKSGNEDKVREVEKEIFVEISEAIDFAKNAEYPTDLGC